MQFTDAGKQRVTSAKFSLALHDFVDRKFKSEFGLDPDVEKMSPIELEAYYGVVVVCVAWVACGGQDYYPPTKDEEETLKFVTLHKKEAHGLADQCIAAGRGDVPPKWVQ